MGLGLCSTGAALPPQKSRRPLPTRRNASDPRLAFKSFSAVGISRINKLTLLLTHLARAFQTAPRGLVPQTSLHLRIFKRIWLHPHVGLSGPANQPEHNPPSVTVGHQNVSYTHSTELYSKPQELSEHCYYQMQVTK